MEFGRYDDSDTMAKSKNRKQLIINAMRSLYDLKVSSHEAKGLLGTYRAGRRGEAQKTHVEGHIAGM